MLTTFQAVKEPFHHNKTYSSTPTQQDFSAGSEFSMYNNTGGKGKLPGGAAV